MVLAAGSPVRVASHWDALLRRRHGSGDDLWCWNVAGSSGFAPAVDGPRGLLLPSGGCARRHAHGGLLVRAVVVWLRLYRAIAGSGDHRRDVVHRPDGGLRIGRRAARVLLRTAGPRVGVWRRGKPDGRPTPQNIVSNPRREKFHATRLNYL